MRPNSSCARPTAPRCGWCVGATIISPDAPRALSWRFMWRHPAHFIALGAGAGLAPAAPGTVGTLLAFPLYWLLAASSTSAVTLAILGSAFLLGIWACGATGRALGIADHGAVV